MSLSMGPQLPFTMGRFTLCEELGAGGMATVFLAKMRLAAGLERSVAIKTIHTHLAKQQAFVDMFLDEAKIASHISHPNVCSVYDFGDIQGLYYIAMEYLVGVPLIELVNAVVEAQDDELLDTVPYLAARIIADACEGLHAAHTLRGTDGKSLRVIHRDVSPQNLFVTYEGSTKVVDFGCAKALERVTQTNTGVMKGKVAYAAPEQLRGEELDARVDVFALGVCLWECLTLSNLFRRDNAILTAQAVLEDEIPRADEGNDWVPKPLAAIAHKALSRDREGRFDSARDLGRALRAWIAGSGTVFESAEVADVMEKLFSSRHADTMKRLDAIQKIEVSQVGPVSTPSGDARGPVDSQPAKAGPLADTVPPPKRNKGKRKDLAQADTKVATPKREPNAWELSAAGAHDDDPVVLPTRTPRYVAALLLLAALIGGGVYAYLYHRAPIFAALGIEAEDADDDAVAGDDVGNEPVDLTGDEPLTNDPAAVDAPPEEDPDAVAEGDEALDGDEGDADEAGDEAPEENSITTTFGSNTDTLEPASASGSSSSGSSSRRSRRRATREEEPEPATPPTPSSGEEQLARPTRTLDFSQGTVVVNVSRGWAIVEHYGQRLGRTPLRTQLPAGRQTLRILPSGRGPAITRTVNVSWGAPTSVHVDVPSGNFDNPYDD